MGKKRKADYFDLFEKQSEAAVAEAQLLIEVIDSYTSGKSVRALMERARSGRTRATSTATPSTRCCRTTSSRPSSARTSSR